MVEGFVLSLQGDKGDEGGIGFPGEKVRNLICFCMV